MEHRNIMMMECHKQLGFTGRKILDHILIKRTNSRKTSTESIHWDA